MIESYTGDDFKLLPYDYTKLWPTNIINLSLDRATSELRRFLLISSYDHDMVANYDLQTINDVLTLLDVATEEFKDSSRVVIVPGKHTYDYTYDYTSANHEESFTVYVLKIIVDGKFTANFYKVVMCEID